MGNVGQNGTRKAGGFCRESSHLPWEQPVHSTEPGVPYGPENRKEKLADVGVSTN